VTTLLGLAGITCSAMIYLVPARPAWNMRHTAIEFHLSGWILGPLFAASAGVSSAPWLFTMVAAASGAQLLNQSLKFFAMIRSDRFELESSARLLSSQLRSLVLWRGATLICGGIVLPLAAEGQLAAGAALVVALASEILGRYLFFVSVVPKNMAASYHLPEAA
jgi:DMSO reductase anchor subunit